MLPPQAHSREIRQRERVKSARQRNMSSHSFNCVEMVIAAPKYARTVIVRVQTLTPNAIVSCASLVLLT